MAISFGKSKKSGLSLNSNSNGVFLNIRYGGIRYKQRIDTPAQQRQEDQVSEVYESANSGVISDASSEQFLEAIKTSLAKPRYAWIVAIVLLILFGCLATIMNPQNAESRRVPSKMQPFISWTYLILAGIGVYNVNKADKKRREITIAYNLPEEKKKEVEVLINNVKVLGNSKKIWKILTSTSVSDQKHNAGASSLLKRQVVTTKMEAPSFMNIDVPVMKVNSVRNQLYFFPDRLLIIKGKKVGAISFSNISLDNSTTRFIESGMGVPSDAAKVDETWQYVNKSGGPDRRMKNNRKYPVMEYGTLHFTSNEGLNEFFHVSNVKNTESFTQAFLTMKNALRD